MKALTIAVILVLAFTPTVAADPAPDAEPKDVYLPNHMECLWNGSWKVLAETPIVRVWYYSCDGPDA